MSTVVKVTSGSTLIYRFVSRIFPLVKRELQRWKELAAQCPDVALAEQALASIEHKGFHCQGGSIYGLYPGVQSEDVVEFVVAYQTISDYLDNLVDSLEVHDEKAFRQLHLAMQEAINPSAALSDYYLYYPFCADGGYLSNLVKTCQAKVSSLPSYALIKPDMLRLADLYSCLQTYKHLALSQREQKMLDWIKPLLKDYPGISPWEFAAASGSTLGVFCLFAAASSPSLNPATVSRIVEAYFPWICGLHILLDYFIDLDEDKQTAQLNFIQYYSSEQEIRSRLSQFVVESLQQAKNLPFAGFHKAVVRGLLAMYLSDQKSRAGDIRPITGELLTYGGSKVKVLHWLCCRLRDRQVI